MNSKERVRTSILHQKPDRIPTDFWAVKEQKDALKKHFHTDSIDTVYEKLGVDTVWIEPRYIGPELKRYRDGEDWICQTFFGNYLRMHWNGFEYNALAEILPLDSCETAQDVDQYSWPSADWFDYEDFKRQCEHYKGKAILIGDHGVYQYATFLRSAENLYMDMVMNEELAHRIFEKFSLFEMEHYERLLQAADGQVDILRVCDDYGGQNSMIFSIPMWENYFAENTRKLADLAHRYGAFYMQHSCGAVRPIISHLIDCGTDILDPIQKVVGMEPESLQEEFGGKICFHGGIDTQYLLPHGTPEQVHEETLRFIRTLGQNGGYILSASQALEGDIPVENILAMYHTCREL